MCGIAGIVSAAAPPDRARLQAAAALLAHRGPDDEGTEIVGTAPPFAGLAHRRLSIIDLTAAGRQPMAGPGGTWIVFNGEIYNYRELRAELARAGQAFRSASDTEVILAAYERWGDACVERLDGMFAFAVWDVARKRLLAARDRFGEKPFWYHIDADGSFRFASELRALLALGGIAREVDPSALAEYLVYQYVPAPRSILKGVVKLPPGHRLSWESGQVRVEPYWSPVPRAQAPREAGEAGRELRSLLEASVSARLVSDVPVGAFLSGGIDSSIVTALMSRATGARVPTFSIGFAERTHDETRYARLVAERYGTDHHEFTVQPSALDLLPSLIDHYGEPFADSSAIPTWYLARETSRHLKVVLTGDGGDELFMGYDRYRAAERAALFDRLPSALRKAAASQAIQNILSTGRDPSLRRKAARFLRHLARRPERRYLAWAGIFHPDELPSLLTPEIRRSCGNPAAYIEEAFASGSDLPDFLSRTARADLVTYLPNDLLVKVDVAAMASGLEARCPFLSPSLAQFALAVPTRLKMRGGRGKRILKEAFRDLLPEEILRRPKMGFGVPLSAWFRGPLRGLLEETLSTRRISERGWLDPDAVWSLVRSHLSGRRSEPYRLWSLLVLETWAERFL